MNEAKNLTYIIFPCENIANAWMGHCIELDCVSQGKDPLDALRMVMEAAQMIWEEDRKLGIDPKDRGGIFNTRQILEDIPIFKKALET